MRLGRTPDDLKDRAGEGVAPGKFLKISRVFRRKDDKVGLCVAATHTGGWKVDDTLADELANLARLLIKGHVSFLLTIIFCVLGLRQRFMAPRRQRSAARWASSASCASVMDTFSKRTLSPILSWARMRKSAEMTLAIFV